MRTLAYVVIGLAISNILLQIFPLTSELWNSRLEGLIMLVTFFLEVSEERNGIPLGLYSIKKGFDAYEAGCSLTKLQLTLWFKPDIPEVLDSFLKNLSWQITVFCLLRCFCILIFFNWEKPDDDGNKGIAVQMKELYEKISVLKRMLTWRVPIPSITDQLKELLKRAKRRSALRCNLRSTQTKWRFTIPVVDTGKTHSSVENTAKSSNGAVEGVKGKKKKKVPSAY